MSNFVSEIKQIHRSTLVPARGRGNEAPTYINTVSSIDNRHSLGVEWSVVNYITTSEYKRVIEVVR